MKGNIFNIQHYTIHDGPGIRTELFMKGCPLSCKWCSNPEGISGKSQPGIYAARCISQKKCGLCMDACKNANDGGEMPLSFYRGKPVIDRSLCTGCLECHSACPADAIKTWGREYSLQEVMEEILRDRGYYSRSGGGVTLSGGEPLMQPDFAKAVLKACREDGIHTCLESSLHVDREALERVTPYVNMFLVDIKMMNPVKHRECTGADNSLILENLQWLSRQGADIIIRIPVIPKVNDNMTNMEQTGDFIQKEMGSRISGLQLLSYMRLGEEKYKSLDRPYEMKGLRFNRKAFQKRVEGFAEYFNSRGIHCTVGTREKE
ncbi:MAG: glycyl-radical enzyme activating protein [Lentihominibacter sp.]